MAVTVQRIGTQSPARQKERRARTLLSVLFQINCAGAKRRENVSLSKYVQAELYISVELTVKLWYISTINICISDDWDHLFHADRSVGGCQTLNTSH